VKGRLQQELTRSQAQCQELEDSCISLRYFIVKSNDWWTVRGRSRGG
jgi:hypothetical protein